jgi:hypothetical protein
MSKDFHKLNIHVLHQNSHYISTHDITHHLYAEDSSISRQDTQWLREKSSKKPQKIRLPVFNNNTNLFIYAMIFHTYRLVYIRFQLVAAELNSLFLSILDILQSLKYFGADLIFSFEVFELIPSFFLLRYELLLFSFPRENGNFRSLVGVTS